MATITPDRTVPRGISGRGHRTAANPLSPTTYLFRNAGKTIPLVGVLMLAVMLVAGIISMINSIPLSIRSIYAYSQVMLGIGPRGDSTRLPGILETIRKESPFEISRIMVCRAASTQVHSIVGKWPFVVIGLETEDMPFYLERMNSTGLQGRLPIPGLPEAVVSEPVARNLGLTIGSEVQGPTNTDSFSPSSVRVVGIAKTSMWLLFTSIDYQKAYHFPPVDLALVFAKNRDEQEKLDRWAEERFKGNPVQIFAFFQVEKSTNEMFQTLYKILNVVIGTLVLVITFMMGLLMNIYQSQRMVEFGLLQALGYTRKALLKRVLTEAIGVIVLGWVFGMALAYGLLNIVKRLLMDPRAFSLDTLDPVAYAYTIPLPIAILLVATISLISRFRRYDPVGVVERRLV